MKRWVAYQGRLFETYVYRDRLHRAFVQFPIDGERYWTIIDHKDVEIAYDRKSDIFHEPGLREETYLHLAKQRKGAARR